MSLITQEVRESLSLVEDLKFFLATAPANWQENQVIRRYYLNNDEGFVSCVFWNNLYFITGTDIVRCILYKFQHFGRTVTDRKKFEEGIFSDLRNLKAGTDAVLENPKLEFLEFLYKNSCLRTQKKQKVFFWFNVPHDKLMADALERDIKKEKANQTPTSVALREPALLFNYVEDKTKSLYEQLCEHLGQLKFEPAKLEVASDGGLDLPDYDSSGAALVPLKLTSDTSYTSQYASQNEKQSRGSQNQGQNQGQSHESRQSQNHHSHGNNNYTTANDDDDDDFPLDYVDQILNGHDAFAANAAPGSGHGPGPGSAGSDWAGRDYAGRDYITLDNQPLHGAASGNYGTAFDSDLEHLDASVFQNANSVNVVSNDDYLIEQTVPARGGSGFGGGGGYGGGLFSPSLLFYPRLAKFYDEQAFLHQPMGFTPVLLFPQMPPSALMALVGPYGYELLGFHVQDATSMYPHMAYEPDALRPQLTPLAPLALLGQMHSVYPMMQMDAGGPVYGYPGYPDEVEALMRGSMASQRQQEVSNSMMRKRKQLLNSQGALKVAKNHRGAHASSIRLADYEPKPRVQVKKEDEAGGEGNGGSGDDGVSNGTTENAITSVLPAIDGIGGIDSTEAADGIIAGAIPSAIAGTITDHSSSKSM